MICSQMDRPWKIRTLQDPKELCSLETGQSHMQEAVIATRHFVSRAVCGRSCHFKWEKIDMACHPGWPSGVGAPRLRPGGG